MTFLCLACYHKGDEFMIAAHEMGCDVYLVTKESLKDAPWPRYALKDVFLVPEDQKEGDELDTMISGLAHLMKSTKIDRIVALDDFDVERAAALREYFRIPGMGQTTVRHFRDKLSMREKAESCGIKVPPYSSLFNDASINHYLQSVSAPWIIKPRAEASATGIKKVHNAEEAWNHIHALGEHRKDYLIEQFITGDVYHVDSLNKQKSIIFSRCSKYLNPPFEVAHGGGIFQTVALNEDDNTTIRLKEVNQKLLSDFGLVLGASHSEFLISSADDVIYFIETASRVGGAHISDMIFHASGLNLWKEWAHLELAEASNSHYELPDVHETSAGLIVSLSKDKDVDYGLFNAPDIQWTMEKDYHVGLIITTESAEKTVARLTDLAHTIYEHLHASLPAADKSTH